MPYTQSANATSLCKCKPAAGVYQRHLERWPQIGVRHPVNTRHWHLEAARQRACGLRKGSKQVFLLLWLVKHPHDLLGGSLRPVRWLPLLFSTQLQFNIAERLPTGAEKIGCLQRISLSIEKATLCVHEGSRLAGR